MFVNISKSMDFDQGNTMIKIISVNYLICLYERY